MGNPISTNCCDTSHDLPPAKQLGMEEENELRLLPEIGTLELQGHEGTVTCLTLTPNNDHVISGGEDEYVCVWHLSSGQCLFRHHVHKNVVNCVASSNSVAVSGSSDGSLIFWDIYNISGVNQFIHKIDLDSSCTCCDIDISSKYVISGESSCDIKVWNVTTGKLFRNLIGHTKAVTCCKILYSKNGEFRALTGHKNSSITLWDVARNEKLNVFKGHNLGSCVNSICISGDNNYCIAAGGDKKIEIFDINIMKAGWARPVKILSGHNSSILSIITSSKDEYVISGNQNGCIRVTVLGSKKNNSHTIQTYSPVYGLAMTYDNNFLLVTNESNIKIIDLRHEIMNSPSQMIELESELSETEC